MLYCFNSLFCFSMKELDVESLLKNRTPSKDSLEDLIKKKNESNEKSFIELRAEELKNLRKSLKLPEKGNLYYPACGSDDSPSLAFPEWEVTYVDAVDDSLEKREKLFFKRNLFNPPFTKEKVFDVVLIVSPGIQFQDEELYGYIDKATENLKKSGFVICNNKHDTASLLEKREDSFEKIKELEDSGEFNVFKKL